MKTHILSLGLILSLSFFACGDSNRYSKEKYENLDKFHEYISHRYDSLNHEYGFERFNFDAEYIYSPEDPARLISSVLDSLTDFDTQIISSKLSHDTYWYEVDFTVNDSAYRYRTEAKTDWANVERLERVLGYIAEDLAPADSFVIPIWPDDQSADVLFGKKNNFKLALEQGFPMDGRGVHWGLGQRLVEGGNIYYLAVERQPSYQEAKTLLLEGLAQLDQMGYQVPQLNKNRVYLSDLFKDNEIIISINGAIGNSHIDLEDETLGFVYYGYAPIILWKMLQNRPDAQITVPIESGKDVILSKEEFEQLFFDLLAHKE